MMDDATRFATLHFAPMALIHICLSHRCQIQFEDGIQFKLKID